MTDPTNSIPAAPTTVKISINDGVKHVQLIVDDLESVAEVAATLAGDAPLAQLVANIGQLADAALSGYEDAASVTITADNIAALQSTLQLDPVEKK